MKHSPDAHILPPVGEWHQIYAMATEGRHRPSPSTPAMVESPSPYTPAMVESAFIRLRLPRPGRACALTCLIENEMLIGSVRI